MGVCPNCGSWVDEGDTCNCCGGSGRHDDEQEETPQITYQDYQDEAWKLYEDYRDLEALDSINKAIELDPLKSSNWNVKGIILHDMVFDDASYFEMSVDCYNRALELHEDSKVIKNNKARCLCDWAWHFINNRQYSTALEKIDEALPLHRAKNLDYAFSLNAKAVILNKLNDIEAAEKYYRQALTYDAENEIFKDNLENIPRAIDYEYTGDMEITEILHNYQKRELTCILEMGNYSNSKLERGMIFTIQKLRRYDEARHNHVFEYWAFFQNRPIGKLLDNPQLKINSLTSLAEDMGIEDGDKVKYMMEYMGLPIVRLI